MTSGTVLLDTNILIDLIGGEQQAFAHLSTEDGFAISRVTWIEVLTGLRPDEELILRDVLSSTSILEISTEIAQRTIQLRRTTKLKLADALIYATALEHGMTLLTRNTRDFRSDWPGVYIPYTLTPLQ